MIEPTRFAPHPWDWIGSGKPGSNGLYNVYVTDKDDLRAHIESRFVDGMGWHNIGAWHVDHKRPLSSFNITGPDCSEFKAAWSLDNLQPLWARDNLSKGARWTP